jgi:hypothetical protein
VADDDQAASAARHLRVFGEEILLDPPLVDLLSDIEAHLERLAARYGPGASLAQRHDVIDEALDELDRALERVRDARGKITRIEVRLVAAYERALAELRGVERDGASGG